MQAPPSRYRVIERKGRLEVIDTWAGHRPVSAHVPLAPVATEPVAAAPGIVEADSVEERWPDFAPEPPALDPGPTTAPYAAPPPPDRTAYASPDFLQMVATTLCNDERDEQGRLILNTMPVYDGKGPRDIPLDVAGQRAVAQAALILLGIAVGAVIFVVVVGWFGFVMLFIAAAFSSIAKTGSTRWLDRIEARSF